jgi:hypothetical protein
LESDASTCASMDVRDDALLAWSCGRVVVHPTKARLQAATTDENARVRRLVRRFMVFMMFPLQ